MVKGLAELQCAKLHVPFPRGTCVIPKMYKLYGHRFENRFFTSRSTHKNRDGSNIAFERVIKQYPYIYSELFDTIELPIKYNRNLRYFVDLDALALMDMRNFVPKQIFPA